MNDRQDLDLGAIRQRLEAERAELLALSAGAAEERRPVELDQQSVGRLSRIDALQVQAMAQAVEGRRRGRLQAIEAALKRLEADDYGYCSDCGEDIPAKRLEIAPATMRCVDCAG
ncbi:MAG: TraR/DksA family transcriptional regulator [Kiloniellales bacterium]|nr:TraR/DksA family transcriptional regulator [Kiloniellales bacterium]